MGWWEALRNHHYTTYTPITPFLIHGEQQPTSKNYPKSKNIAKQKKKLQRLQQKTIMVNHQRIFFPKRPGTKSDTPSTPSLRSDRAAGAEHLPLLGHDDLQGLVLASSETWGCFFVFVLVWGGFWCFYFWCLSFFYFLMLKRFVWGIWLAEIRLGTDAWRSLQVTRGKHFSSSNMLQRGFSETHSMVYDSKRSQNQVGGEAQQVFFGIIFLKTKRVFF